MARRRVKKPQWGCYEGKNGMRWFSRKLKRHMKKQAVRYQRRNSSSTKEARAYTWAGSEFWF